MTLRDIIQPLYDKASGAAKAAMIAVPLTLGLSANANAQEAKAHVNQNEVRVENTQPVVDQMPIYQETNGEWTRVGLLSKYSPVAERHRGRNLKTGERVWLTFGDAMALEDGRFSDLSHIDVDRPMFFEHQRGESIDLENTREATGETVEITVDGQRRRLYGTLAHYTAPEEKLLHTIEGTMRERGGGTSGVTLIGIDTDHLARGISEDSINKLVNKRAQELYLSWRNQHEISTVRTTTPFTREAYSRFDIGGQLLGRLGGFDAAGADGTSVYAGLRAAATFQANGKDGLIILAPSAEISRHLESESGEGAATADQIVRRIDGLGAITKGRLALGASGFYDHRTSSRQNNSLTELTYSSHGLNFLAGRATTRGAILGGFGTGQWSQTRDLNEDEARERGYSEEAIMNWSPERETTHRNWGPALAYAGSTKNVSLNAAAHAYVLGDGIPDARAAADLSIGITKGFTLTLHPEIQHVGESSGEFVTGPYTNAALGVGVDVRF